MDNDISMGERIRRAIGYRGRTQKEIAQAIGISPNSLTKIVRGDTVHPSALIIRDLARELEVSPDFLLGLSDDIERVSK